MQHTPTDSLRSTSVDFLAKLTEHQIYAREFFNTDLLNAIDRAFPSDNSAVYYYDTDGKFLSVLTHDGLEAATESNPYTSFSGLDVVRHTAHRDAVRDHLTYFNTVPRIYKSTDIICDVAYDDSSYTRFLETTMHAHYVVVLAFGINAYIQLAFYKTRDHGDFTEDEMNALEQLYIYLASAYRTFKKYEQSNIIADIMSKIIRTGKRAFFVADDFSHLLNCNELAEDYLDELLGPQALEQMSPEETCPWLPFLIGMGRRSAQGSAYVHSIKEYTFEVNVYDRTYTNGIVDRYYWATISKTGDVRGAAPRDPLSLFTRTEQRVAALLDEGLTYQEIADRLIISFHTVKKHVQSIYRKCGVKNRMQFSKWLNETRSV